MPANIDRVNQEAAAVDALLRQCCADAAGAGTEMADRVLRISSLFRKDNLEAGNAGLTGLTADLGGLATLLDAITNSPTVEREWTAVDDSAPREQLDRLAGWLDALVNAQAQGDWIAVSDVLEYDLEPALRRWERQLQAVAA